MWIHARVDWPEHQSLVNQRQVEYRVLTERCINGKGNIWLEDRERVVLDVKKLDVEGIPVENRFVEVRDDVQSRLRVNLCTIRYVPLLLRRPGINPKLKKEMEKEGSDFRRLQEEGFRNFAPIGLSLFIRSEWTLDLIDQNKTHCQILLGYRSDDLPINPGILQPSVDEGLSRGDSLDVLRFGIEEELGCPPSVANLVAELASRAESYRGICTSLVDERHQLMTDSHSTNRAPDSPFNLVYEAEIKDPSDHFMSGPFDSDQVVSRDERSLFDRFWNLLTGSQSASSRNKEDPESAVPEMLKISESVTLVTDRCEFTFSRSELPKKDSPEERDDSRFGRAISEEFKTLVLFQITCEKKENTSSKSVTPYEDIQSAIEKVLNQLRDSVKEELKKVKPVGDDMNQGIIDNSMENGVSPVVVEYVSSLISMHVEKIQQESGVQK